ncbi:NACHT, LRR and PYD domains-containing protein 3-like [Petromyzon marinus]|uniref:NACHT, LRR and PYD domains-containing protein 3-like n=1 Tax=Petromyzon marinus TaxID=7757 RepID=UPI003F6FD0FA
MVKPILVPYYRHQETKQHELLARGKQHKELMKRAQREGMTYNNIFDLIGKETHPRLVIVVGTPGSGKTMLSKFIVHSLLSGERVFARRFEHIVLITFREINDVGEVSLAELFSVLHSCLGKKADEVYANQERTLFVMDGLDEFGKCLHYANACTDPRKTATVEGIIAALVNGNLLPKASVLITTRPIAMAQLSGVNVDRAVEIAGFSHEDKGSCYSFSHLTIQEFFAAIAMHLTHSTRPVSDIIKAIEDSKDGRFDVFQRFFCGLASSTPWMFFEGILDPPSADSQKEIIEWLNHNMENQKVDKHRLISLLHCVHELHDRKSMSDATRSMTEIDLSFTRLSLPDCAAITSILLHREEPVETLNLFDCGIGTEEMKRLQPGLHRCKELV